MTDPVESNYQQKEAKAAEEQAALVEKNRPILEAIKQNIENNPNLKQGISQEAFYNFTTIFKDIDLSENTKYIDNEGGIRSVKDTYSHPEIIEKFAIACRIYKPEHENELFPSEEMKDVRKAVDDLKFYNTDLKKVEQEQEAREKADQQIKSIKEGTKDFTIEDDSSKKNLKDRIIDKIIVNISNQMLKEHEEKSGKKYKKPNDFLCTKFNKLKPKLSEIPNNALEDLLFYKEKNKDGKETTKPIHEHPEIPKLFKKFIDKKIDISKLLDNIDKVRKLEENPDLKKGFSSAVKNILKGVKKQFKSNSSDKTSSRYNPRNGGSINI